ncbi:DUF177 domain-containing protein [Bartonella sp. DGB1]|uniref:YceD family protein n=1 Tax=Bartonella sp. DGB1 TaxID=3239807 RepID=UPI0035233EC2
MSVTDNLNVFVSIINLPPQGRRITFVADEPQKAMLANKHGVNYIQNFEFDFKVIPHNTMGYKVQGMIKVTFEQLCVVSLSTIIQNYQEEIKVFFTPEKLSAKKIVTNNKIEEIIVDMEDEYDIETFIGSEINLGNLAEEFFQLNIPAFPKSCETNGDYSYPMQKTEYHEPSIGEKNFIALSKLKLKK